MGLCLARMDDQHRHGYERRYKDGADEWEEGELGLPDADELMAVQLS
jgi:hypothetical protein